MKTKKMVTQFNSKDMILFANFSKNIEGPVKKGHLKNWKMGQDFKNDIPVVQTHYAVVMDPRHALVGNQEYLIHPHSPHIASEVETGQRVEGYFLPSEDVMNFVVIGPLAGGDTPENAHLSNMIKDESVKGWVLTSFGVCYFRSNERIDYQDPETPSQWRGQVLLHKDVSMADGSKWYDLDYWKTRSEIHHRPDLLLESQEKNIEYQKEIVAAL